MKHKKKYKVYIYGMGNEYNRLASYLPLYKDELDVLGIVTTQRQGISYLDKYPCMTVDEIDPDGFDYMIIAVANWKEILGIVKQYEIDEDKILIGSIFYNPCFDLEEYIKLKNSHVSILSNTCLGGMIYQELGLKRLSPTINMFCGEGGSDYLEFIENYRYYLKQEMKEYQNNGMEMMNGFFYPKGILGNRIVWYFPHDIYASDAIEGWNKRAKKLNMDNIAVLATLYNDEDAYRFSELKIDKKLGIYFKDLGLKNIVYCPAWNDAKERAKFGGRWMWATVWYLSNKNGYRSPVDWIRFLNGSSEYMRSY